MSKLKPKILFILPSLRTGGAERVMSFLAANLNRNEFSPHLVVIGHEGDQSYSVDGIPVTFLNKNKVRQSIPAMVKFLLRSKPNVVISAIGHLNTLMSLFSPFFPKTRFIGRETNVAGVVKGKKKVGYLQLLGKVRGLTLDAIICQSEDMRSSVAKINKIPETKIFVINNPISDKFKLKKKISKSSVFKFVTVGRLVQVKGHLRVLETLEKVETPFHYTIIGDGPEKKRIREFINEKKLNDRVSMINFSNEIQCHLSESDLFLQGSYTEGFPNALLESCAVGTPVVAFKSPGGTREIIVEGVNGFFAEDQKDFLLKLNTAIDTNWDKQEVRKSVTEKFSKEIIVQQYENLFKKLL